MVWFFKKKNKFEKRSEKHGMITLKIINLTFSSCFIFAIIEEFFNLFYYQGKKKIILK